MSFNFTARLWEYDGEAPWVFVTLPIELADEIDDMVAERRGFGSIRVAVRTGTSEWSTSLFPDKASGSFVLPVKREIRAAESIEPGDETHFELTLEQSNA